MKIFIPDGEQRWGNKVNFEAMQSEPPLDPPDAPECDCGAPVQRWGQRPRSKEARTTQMNDQCDCGGGDTVFIWATNAAEQLDGLLSNPEPIRATENTEE